MHRLLPILCLSVAALSAAASDANADSAFRRGRELIDLGRPGEAAENLRAVPADSPLYPYAARGILYCAWQDPALDFEGLVTPLTQAKVSDIALLATEALVEHALQSGRVPQAELEKLRAAAAGHPELGSLCRLWQIDVLRLQGKYEQAIAEERHLESDRSLSAEMRLRARMALAEVFYDAAQNTAAEEPEPTAADDEAELPEEEENGPMTVPRGQGEETLLHLIASYPDSDLLPEFFRRLAAHDAFRNSSTAVERLREWAADTRKPRRAVMALLQLNALRNPENAPELAVDNSYANKALADFPHESGTDTLLLEQARLLLRRGDREGAAVYLAHLSSAAADSPQAAFLKASAKTAPAARLTDFRALAERAPQQLQRPAWMNAALSALQSGQHDTVQAMLEAPELPNPIRRDLLVLNGTYDPDATPATTLAVLEEMLRQDLPEPLRREVQLNLAYLYPAAASEALLSPINPAALSDEQLLRYYALRERNAGDSAAAIRLLRGAIDTVAGREAVETALSIHLSHVLSAAEHHRAALRLLLHLAKRYPKGDRTRRALYLAAHQAELIGTPASLREAMELYARCTEGNDTTAAHAAIREANILTRLGHPKEALQHLNLLSKRDTDHSTTERALINSARANACAICGTAESTQQAIDIISETIGLPDLPRRWRVLSLLHRATLYSRLGRANDALSDDLTVLSERPQDMSTLSPAETQDYYLAASGVIMRRLREEHYDEAADLATEAAAWAPEACPDISRHFREWADIIRKQHFLPAE